MINAVSLNCFPWRIKRGKEPDNGSVPKLWPHAIRMTDQKTNFAERLLEMARRRKLDTILPVTLLMPHLTESQCREVTERLNAWRRVCGCKMGAWWMSAGFAVSLAAILARYREAGPALWLHLPLAFVAAILCAGVGKVLGIATERRALRRELIVMLDQISPAANRVPDAFTGHHSLIEKQSSL